MARRFGVTDPQIAGLLEEGPPGAFSPAELSALAFAEELTRRPTGVGGETWKALREHYSDREIVEITAVVGLFNAFNRFNNALEVDLTVYPPGRMSSSSDSSCR